MLELWKKELDDRSLIANNIIYNVNLHKIENWEKLKLDELHISYSIAFDSNFEMRRWRDDVVYS